MPDIVLTTLNAKYIHTAFGLRYLLANLGDLQSRAALREFDINQRPLEIVEAASISGTSRNPPRSSPSSNASGRKSKSYLAAQKSAMKPTDRKSSNSPTTSSPAKVI